MAGETDEATEATALDRLTPAGSRFDDDLVAGDNWSDLDHRSLARSRRHAWIIAGGAALVAVLEAFALTQLVPLKTIVPYTILVDRRTGDTAMTQGIVLGAVTRNELVVRSALTQYVLAREDLNAADLAENYRKVGLWSVGAARAEYLHDIDPTNPAGVIATANQATHIATSVRSISLLGKNTAVVRFGTSRRDGSGPEVKSQWSATVEYGFSGEPLSAADRLINPLGFYVRTYRRMPDRLAG